MTSPVAATVGPNGISAPNYATILAYFVAKYQAIFGADSYLGNDSQDGQLLGIFTEAVNDCNAAAIAVYNSFSPATGQGAGLSSNVKLNGLARIQGSFSSATVTCVGVAGTVINNGQAQDTSGNTWALPPTVTIPNAGTIDVTATCTTLGAITASANTINQIATPTLGWQSVNNAAQATPGVGVETDAALRVRQSNSVALPSTTVFSGIAAAIVQVPGVTRLTSYENNTNSTDSNGVPANNLCFVVECPSTVQAAVAQAIASKMPPGTPTYGNVSQTVTQTVNGILVTRTINQQTPTESTFGAAVSVHTLNGWSDATIALIQAAVQAYFSSVPIGGVVNVASVVQAALLPAQPGVQGTYLVKAVTVNKNSGSPQSTDFALGGFEAAAPGTVTVSKV